MRIAGWFGAALVAVLPLGARAADTVPRLVERLERGTPDERTRAAALLSAEADDPAAFSALVRAAAEAPAETRIAALRGLARTGRKEAVAPVTRAAWSEDGAVADEARRGLLALAIERNGPALIASFDGQPRARVALVPALAALADASAWGRIGTALADADPAVRAAADRAVRLAAPAGRERALSACLEEDRVEDVRPCLALAGDLRVTQAAGLVVPFALDPFAAPELREAAREALRAMKDDLDLAAQVEIARTGAVASARAQAVGILAVFPGERSYVALVHALADEAETVRVAAAEGLAELGDSRAAAPLSKAAEDPRNARSKKIFEQALRRVTR